MQLRSQTDLVELQNQLSVKKIALLCGASLSYVYMSFWNSRLLNDTMMDVMFGASAERYVEGNRERQRLYPVSIMDPAY